VALKRRFIDNAGSKRWEQRRINLPRNQPSKLHEVMPDSVYLMACHGDKAIANASVTKTWEV
jgi:hypothetical protein